MLVTCPFRRGTKGDLLPVPLASFTLNLPSLQMIKSNFLLPACAFAIALSLLLIRRARRRHKDIPLPPGPKGLPLIGNPQAVRPGKRPGDYRWERFLQWSRDYASPDAVSVEVFGEQMIVLNSYKAVTELLEKRSANYSDRPAMRMNVELSGWYWNFAHMRYSARWRFHRKTFHQYFQPRMMPEHYEIQRVATEKMIRKILTSPEDFVDHAREHSGSIILKTVYGYDLQEENDPYLLLVRNALPGIIETSVPGSFLVDFLPILKFVPSWFPGAGFKRKAKLWKKYSENLRDLPWEWLMNSITQGTAKPSFVTRNLEKLSPFMENEERQAMEEVVRNCAGISFLAGSDTSVTAILSFILNMARHPEIQARAQSEIDSLGRLPDFADKDKLPFVGAVIAETLRCDPVAPLAVPHAALEDDVYEGMRIPKGSTVVGNTWAVLHDEELYPDPMTFNPDRFMKKDGEELPPHPEMFEFGFGRRICPGRYLALNSIWIAASHILATFTITRDEDEPVVFHDALVRHPDPFKCKFIPRSKSGLKDN